MTDTYNLISQAQKGDKKSEQELCRRNIALVHSCVRRINYSSYDYEELVQVGSIGLIKAIRGFDLSRGLKLSTYALPHIMGEIKRFVRDNSSIKVSRSLKEMWMKACSARKVLSGELMREPTIGEIAQKIGTSIEELTIAMEASRECDSLERKVNSDEKGAIYLADTIASPESFDSHIDKIALSQALGKLSDREKKIVLLRYFRACTQTEVSKTIGVSQVQISRIEKNIIKKLKNIMQ